jgi:hypothetical protein
MSEIINILRDLTTPQYAEKKYLGADRAINAVIVSGLVASFEEFEKILVEVISLVQKYVLKVQRPVKGAREFYLDTAFRVLQKKHGPNGEKAAFEFSRTGKNGGVNAVIRSIAYGYTDVLFENESKARVGVLFEKLSHDQKFAVMDEYIKEFGYLWPDELIENGAVRLKMNFPKTLQLHIENIRKLTKSMDG